MKYYSTNKKAPIADLHKAVVKGLAEDRGLYMPEIIKKLPQDFFDNFEKLRYQEIAYGAGLIKIGEDVYYVRSNGKVATGEYYITNTNGLEGYTAGQKLTFGEDGKLTPKKNGVVDGYYYVDDKVCCGAGVIEQIDENGDVYYIYVRSNGKLATGKYWPTNRNGYLPRGEYDWGTDGKYYPEK